MSDAKKIAEITLAGLITAGALTVAGCNLSHTSSKSKLVGCYGVSKLGADVPVMMSEGDCEKIAGSKAQPVDANSYVACYGVAAAGKNDCGTNTSACGGSASADRLANAWIALPKSICTQLQGAVVGELSKAKKS